MATASKQPLVKDAGTSSVHVEIFDQGYNLRGSDADYILKLAEFVDGKMRAVAEQTHTVDTARVAVLAALNLADELLQIKRGGGPTASDYVRRAHRLANVLDEVLQEQRRPD
jgi:cell division protein ZapA